MLIEEPMNNIIENKKIYSLKHTKGTFSSNRTSKEVGVAL